MFGPSKVCFWHKMPLIMPFFRRCIAVIPSHLYVGIFGGTKKSIITRKFRHTFEGPIESMSACTRPLNHIVVASRTRARAYSLLDRGSLLAYCRHAATTDRPVAAADTGRQSPLQQGFCASRILQYSCHRKGSCRTSARAAAAAAARRRAAAAPRARARRA